VGTPKKKEDWAKTPIFAKLNLKTGELSKTKMCYPDCFKEDEDLNRQLYYASFSYDTDGENIACAFLENDSIYITKDFEHVKAIAAKSRYLEHLEPQPYRTQQNLADHARISENIPRYWSLIYDKYRKVWYRFVFHKNEMPKEQDPFEYTIPQLKFSIMILDKDFNIIGETVMPANTYAYRMWFVGKKGLYLSMNNVKNPIFSEDQLIFQCLELK
ncbi:MAG: DUF4221 family protein, partial [Bacteroidales bacterium]|nr:DUF4221 family protein [Bacteroidales bacterium]